MHACVLVRFDECPRRGTLWYAFLISAFVAVLGTPRIS